MAQWIWRMLIFLLLTTTIHGGRQHKYDIIRERDTLICQGTIHDGIATVTQCMAICSAFSGCRGVFYTGRTRRCRRCSNLNVFGIEEGARFYKRDPDDEICLEQTSSNVHAVAARGQNVCVKRILTVTNGCSFGEWEVPEFCPKGTYAVGYRLKLLDLNGPLFGEYELPKCGCTCVKYSTGYHVLQVEEIQAFMDDTTANALELTCQSVDGSKSGGTIRSGEGRYGDWWTASRCPDKTLLKSFRMQAEQALYGTFDDNTAVSYVEFICYQLWNDMMHASLSIPPGTGIFGKNGEFSETCEVGQGVCGLRVRVENMPPERDNSGLNDVVLYCCS